MEEKWFPENNRKVNIFTNTRTYRTTIDIYDYIAIELAKHNIATYAFDMQDLADVKCKEDISKIMLIGYRRFKIFFDTIVF